MSKGYIYNEDGELEEVLDHSCDGEESLFCPNCGKDVIHYLVAVSNVRGYIWACSACGYEHAA